MRLPGVLQGEPLLPPQQRPLQGQGVHVPTLPLQNGIQRYVRVGSIITFTEGANVYSRYQDSLDMQLQIITTNDIL